MKILNIHNEKKKQIKYQFIHKILLHDNKFDVRMGFATRKYNKVEMSQRARMLDHKNAPINIWTKIK